MSVAITVRNVPEETRDELAARAARAGQSLQAYLRQHLTDTAAQPTLDDVLNRVRARVGVGGITLSADEILAAQDADRG